MPPAPSLSSTSFRGHASPRDEMCPVLEMQPLLEGYFQLALESPFMASRARPGQFAMLRAGNGFIPLTRRPMSFWDAEAESGRVVFFMKEIGPGTRFFRSLSTGDALQVLGPLGKPFDPDFPPGIERVALAAGGTGAAPMFFAARVLRETLPRMPVHLFYGGRSRGHLHLSEFGPLGLDVHAATEDGSMGEKGLVTAPLERFAARYAGKAALLCCGPTPMMKAVDALASRHGLAAQFALEEYMACGIGVCLSCVVKTPGGYARSCQDGPVMKGGSFAWPA
jgi:dihydroorotate dehydrogenase electron transfer subunit